MDSYYLTEAGRNYLREIDVKFVAAINKDRFAHFHRVLGPKVQKPGDWWGIHNSTTSETVVFNWSRDSNVGKKMVISNAFYIHTTRKCAHLIPEYDLYKLTFSACDRFNRVLKDRCWSHKTGGRKRPGDLGCQNSFLQNTIK